MKLRYFFVTVLFLSVFCYGIIVLITAMADRSSIPPTPRLTANITTVQEKEQPRPTTTPAGTHTTADTVKTIVKATPETPPEKDVEITKQHNTPPNAEIIIIPQKPSQWGENTRGIVHRVNVKNTTNVKTLFLTINAYSNNQEALVQELIKHNTKATFFVSGYYVRRNQETAKQIAASQLFEIENLGNRNRSLSVEGRSIYNIAGTTDRDDVLKEVADGAASIVAVTGKRPKYFRSATGYTDDVAVAVVNASGTKVIGYQTVTDGGGTLSSEEIKNRILQAENGSILIISINPERPNILKGLQAALEEVKAKQLPIRFEKLTDYEQDFVTIH